MISPGENYESVNKTACIFQLLEKYGPSQSLPASSLVLCLTQCAVLPPCLSSHKSDRTFTGPVQRLLSSGVLSASLPARTKKQLAVGGNNNKLEKFSPDAPCISSPTVFDGKGQEIIDILGGFQSGRKSMVFAIFWSDPLYL